MMLFYIILIAIYLLIAAVFIKAYSYNHCEFGDSYYEFTLKSILMGLFFPITIISICIYDWYFNKWGYKKYINIMDTKLINGEIVVKKIMEEER